MKKFKDIKDINIEQFDYNLPEEKIAKYPLKKRDNSKLLIYKNNKIVDDLFFNIKDHLPSNSLLVFNNTRVIQARLAFRKKTGARIEIFLLDPYSPADYAQNFEQHTKCQWKCIVGNLKKWKDEILNLTLIINNKEVKLSAKLIDRSIKDHTIEFSWNNDFFTFSELLEAAGEIPIPPYLNRNSEKSDKLNYQTIYSKIDGSVAAPTAGLHFTKDVFNSLPKREIKTAELTLHVGAGTFQPVKSTTIGNHEMHTEHIIIHKEFIKKLSQHKGQIVTVGTTSIRTLESLYYIGCRIIENKIPDNNEFHITQWEPYENNVNHSFKDITEAISGYLKKSDLTILKAYTSIIIVPGYQFKMTDGIITNFHQPKSTLLLLISAFVGEHWSKIYEYALANNYRFLSYGDSNLYFSNRNK